MNSIKNGIKLVATNLAVTIFLLALLLFVPALWSDLSSSMRSNVDVVRATSKSRMPAYVDEDWVDQHYFEFRRLQTRYADFIGWRRTAFSGETITIDDAGFRRHPSSATGADNASVWLFGGSTMWGTGANDAGTIPAQLESLAGRSTFNFGESAYVAHQSLNLLMREYITGGRPDLVVFYDGVNEVLHKCRRELGFYSTSREQQIRARISSDGSQFLKLFAPLMESLGKGLRKAGGAATDGSGWYDCHTDDDKADLIARTLVADWKMARLLAEQNGARFVGVLQPVSYLGDADVSYLPERDREPGLGLQYQAVYPKIRAALDLAGIEYLDLVDVFGAGDQVYVDFCHLSPKGNAVIADRLAAHITDAVSE
jgi:hypothetical protein